MPQADQLWPALPLKEWEETYNTLHMWTQIVGKIRLRLAPLENHWWNVALYVSARGLTTSPIPFHGGEFELEFDFLDHQLRLQTSGGRRDAFPLAGKPVAAFYRETFAMLRKAGIEVTINPKPQEIPNPIPLDEDETHKTYVAEYAQRFWRILLSVDVVFKEFRARWLGKASPVHFFWGSFDLACTRFSGRRAPARTGVITSEAYSHECSSVGWWPGGGEVAGPAFYAYTAPEPPGYAEQHVRPETAVYDNKLREFLLMYDDVRRSSSPHDEILKFAQGAFDAGAKLANWDLHGLERESA